MTGKHSMKKIVRNAILFVMVMAFAVSGTACRQKVTEDTPVRISIDPVDGVFNPFFSTSGPDSTVIGQTQLGMITTDKDGNLAWGEDEACVVYDYSSFTTGSKETQANPDDYSDFYTDYYFAIKDDIVFSDGTPLTIRDVLFNLYMYLDPVFSGSATLYSVNIKGLEEYRTQSGNAADQEGLEDTIRVRAEQAISDIIAWCDDSAAPLSALTETQQGYIDRAKEYFQEEMNSDWTAAETYAGEKNNDYKDRYGLHEAWEIFLYMYSPLGGITVTAKPNPGGNTTYEVQYNGWDKKSDSEKTKDAILTSLFEGYLGDSVRLPLLKKNIKDIFAGAWVTTSNIEDYIRAAERGKYFEEMVEEKGELPFKNIEGIRVEQRTDLPTSASGSTRKLDKSRDVLHIRIDGVDPKAIYNFSFSVSPMHYYSDSELIAAAKADQGIYTEDGGSNFGVEYSSVEFMDRVRAKRVPMGAGPYKASSSNYNDFYNNNFVGYERNDLFLLGAPKIKYIQYKVVSAQQKVGVVIGNTKEVEFSDTSATADVNKQITEAQASDKSIGADDAWTNGYGYIGINAKYVKDIDVRRAIMISFDSSQIQTYFGDMSLASPIYRPMSKESWAYPDDATDYFWNDNVADELGGGSYPTFNEEQAIERITNLVVQAGYTNVTSDGIRYRTSDDILKFTFTIAGSEEQHPARGTFERAEEILEECGFDITIQNDSNALRKLASGSLAVWAAAWSSTIDPDMYQVYHMDSQATSVDNWGYDVILDGGASGDYYREYDLILELSDLIDEAREYTEREDRIPLYHQALDLVMELAVEYPLYQRKDVFVWNGNVIDSETLFKDVTSYASPLAYIWNVNLNY